MSENIVKDYLEELGIISQEQYLDSLFILDDEWEIYRISDDTLFYVYFELSFGGVGYAFCIQITCEKMTWNFESFYYMKTHDNEVKDVWDTDQEVKNLLMSNAMAVLKPF